LPDSLTELGGLKARAEEFLSAVLQAAAQPIWVVDPGGLIRFANPAAVAALGYETSDDLLGRDSHETIHYKHPDGSPYPAHECPMLLPRTTGETVESELDWFFRRDGSMFPVSYVSVPLDLPDGRGAVVAFTDIEARLSAEKLIRARGAMLADEQDALRRVATLVSRGAPPEEVFEAVVDEVAHVLGVPRVELSRFDSDGTLTVIAARSDRPHPFRPGTRWPLEGPTLSARILETGAPTRIDDFTGIAGRIADAVRAFGIRSGAGAPIVVDGDVWGMVATASIAGEPRLPDGIEHRLADFTALVATAISNTQAREDLRRLADEQAALRRVATLVAQGAAPADVFATVAGEIARLLHLPLVEMCRYEADGTATVVAASGEHPFQTGTTWPLDGPSLAAMVRTTGRAARVEDYAHVVGAIGEAARGGGVHAGVGAPIVVDGELWGVVSAGADHREPVPADAERRLSEFTALVATAIANTHAREEVRRLADQEAALRRLATLVAEGAEPRLLFDAVCEETGRLLGANSVNLAHYTPDGFNVTMAGWSLHDVHVPTGTRLRLEGDTVNTLVRDTAAPGRFDSYEGARGELADVLRRLGIRSEVGAPVVVEGCVWGALIAGTDEEEPLPAGAEHRLASFAELIATAISNATARTDLLASRARLVEAADEQRRRVVRDLHDGAQQRLVQSLMTLQRAQARDDLPRDVDALIQDGLRLTRAAIDELRELAHGIHPAILTHHGLAAAVDGLAERAPLPIDVEIPEDRYPTAVESAAYFVAAESLTNVAKYAQASTARVTATCVADALVLAIEDDGIGGARPAPGSGLSGLVDRVAALDGTLTVDSPPGGGTHVRAVIPLADAR
jgi:PAS domain S-box-containing protein